MAKIRKVDYFVLHTANRPGEGAKLLKALKQHDIGLLAFSAFPDARGVQVDFVPEEPRLFQAVARGQGWTLQAKKSGFLVRGKDRTGALASLLGKLGKAGINVTAIDAVAAGKRRFGAIFWVKPQDVARAAKLLGAK